MARWMRAPMASGTWRAARIPAATRSTGTRLISAERSPGKEVARRAMSRARTWLTGSKGRESIASLERPKAFTGAFSTLVSPRLFPVRECADDDGGQELGHPQPLLDHGPIGLDRGHGLRELVEVVVEVPGEDEGALLRDRALLAPVDVARLDGHVGHEGRPRRALAGEREEEGVAVAEHVGAVRVRVGIVEGHAGRAVDDVGQGLAQPLELLLPRSRGSASRCRRPGSGTCAPARLVRCRRFGAGPGPAPGARAPSPPPWSSGRGPSRGAPPPPPRSLAGRRPPGTGSPCPGSRWPR